MKYIRKHSYAPEEQKHARLYEVRGVTKGGHEIPVEVNVTSFVLDGEMFYTGVISEMAKAKDSKRSSVSSSMSDLNEVALQQRVKLGFINFVRFFCCCCQCVYFIHNSQIMQSNYSM